MGYGDAMSGASGLLRGLTYRLSMVSGVSVTGVVVGADADTVSVEPTNGKGGTEPMNRNRVVVARDKIAFYQEIDG